MLCGPFAAPMNMLGREGLKDEREGRGKERRKSIMQNMREIGIGRGEEEEDRK